MKSYKTTIILMMTILLICAAAPSLPAIALNPADTRTDLDYDADRDGFWVGNESDDAELDFVDPANPFDMDDKANLAGAALNPKGDVNGVCVLENGNLLLADFDGDAGVNIDDYIFEFDPDTLALINYWPTDGLWNTSTDGTRVDKVAGVEVGYNGNVFVCSGADQMVHELVLIPGNPGTWYHVNTYTVPGIEDPRGIDWIAGCDSYCGWLIGDRNSTDVVWLSYDFTTLYSYAMNHDGNSFNTGAASLLDAQDNFWLQVVDFWTNKVYGIDSGRDCDYDVLQAPVELDAKQKGGNNVLLTWEDNNDWEHGYIIERKAGHHMPDTDFVEIVRTDENATEYKDQNLDPNYYTYRIRAFSYCGGISDYSDEVYQTTQ